jgi:hypothetical protein
MHIERVAGLEFPEVSWNFRKDKRSPLSILWEGRDFVVRK